MRVYEERFQESLLRFTWAMDLCHIPEGDFVKLLGTFFFTSFFSVLLFLWSFREIQAIAIHSIRMPTYYYTHCYTLYYSAVYY